jgi:hypothetical protein
MSESDDGPLLPARKVLDRYGVCDRTLDRWCAREDLGFPKPIRIHQRRYFRERDLLVWERTRAVGQAVAG